MPPEPDNTPNPTPTGDPWYKTAGADAEIIGHMQNRGWDSKPAEQVAIEAIRSAREAQGFVGLPPERLIRLPADLKDQEGMKSVWGRLGAPDDATGYDFSTVKGVGDKPIDTALADALRAASATAHLPKEAAVTVADAVQKHLDAREAASQSERAAALKTADDALRANWGANYDANLLVARNAAAALGITPEQVATLEGVVGFDKVMELMRNIGSKIGEDKFVSNLNPLVGGVKTREQAVAEKAELMRDTAWTKRYLEGGAAEVRQMTALNTIIVGDGGDGLGGRRL